jgi:hypothetical protein
VCFIDKKTWQSWTETYLASSKKMRGLSCSHHDPLNFYSQKPTTPFYLDDCLKTATILSTRDEVCKTVVQFISSEESSILSELKRWFIVTDGGKREDFTLPDSKGFDFRWETMTPTGLTSETGTRKSFRLYQWWQRYQFKKVLELRLHKKQFTILQSTDIPSITLGWANKWGTFYILKQDLSRLEKELDKANWPLHAPKPTGGLKLPPQTTCDYEHLHEVSEMGCLSFDFE